MQTEAEAFLARIRAYPDDDAPRLVFADWLDEQGDPRGAFIRVQLALAQLEADEAAAPELGSVGRTDREANRTRLRTAERELLVANRTEWEAPFGGLAFGLKFRRGFVEEVNVYARDLVQHGDELFRAGPLRHVHLLNVSGSLAAALQCHYLGRLAALTINASHAGEPLARAVARSVHLAGLKRLSLRRNRFEDDAAEHFAASPTFAAIEELDLRDNLMSETGARALAASPHLGSLRRLELGNNRLGPAGAEALVVSERLTSLAYLGLAENEVGAPRLVSLGRAHDLLRVAILDLSANTFGPAGLQVILTAPAESAAAMRLYDLDLSHNELGDDGARVLSRAPRLEGLRTLRLAGCAIGDDGARALAESPHLNQLVRLDLSNNPIDDSGFREFLRHPSLRVLDYPAQGLSGPMRLRLDSRFLRSRG